jgi:hypothetical protein
MAECDDVYYLVKKKDIEHAFVDVCQRKLVRFRCRTDNFVRMEKRSDHIPSFAE